MKTIICGEKAYPIYEAYCTGKSWLFRLFFGWRASWIDKNGNNRYKYKVWKSDVETLDYLVAEEYSAYEKDCD